MPELPEIRNLAGQIDGALRGATISGAEVSQPKCLNQEMEEWKTLVKGRAIRGASSHGKWVEMAMDDGVCLRLNLGMGGEFLLHERGETPPEKRRILLFLSDGRSISVNFWWFGSLHAVKEGEGHPPFDSLGPDALDPALSEEAFIRLCAGKKGAIKPFLLNQKHIAGMGNYYSHDIFFLAGVHPMRRCLDLSREELARLFRVTREVFDQASKARGADYERDLYNRPGGWSRRLIAYRKGEPCPNCGESIREIGTGATTGYVCPVCQRL